MSSRLTFLLVLHKLIQAANESTMKHLFIVILAVLGALLVGAADQPSTAKAEPRTPDGIWKPITGRLGGAQLPDAALKAITLKLTGTNYEVTVEGEGTDRGTCTLDTSTTPKRMTIRGTDGPNRGKTFLAIYEMRDDRSLRVCYDMSGTQFPKDFQSPKGTKHYLAEYRRGS
jgi:uncharacterized protein (TIGR03067 family)